MKKKTKIISLVLLSLLVVGVSAVLVDYLSNKVTADIEVESPMVAGISEGKVSWLTSQCWRADQGQMVDCFPEGVDEKGVSVTDWDEDDWERTETSIILLDSEGNPVNGGESVTLYTMSQNIANVETKGHEEIRMANPDGVTCLDFDISCRFDSIYGDNGYGTLYTDCASEPECHNIDPNLVEIWSDDDSSTWGAGEADVAQYKITFNPAASGTYTFSYRITPAVPTP